MQEQPRSLAMHIEKEISTKNFINYANAMNLGAIAY